MKQIITQPTFRPDLPSYPIHLQLLRVTATTVSGPSGQLLYTATTQQVRTATLLPRDREPCLVFNANSIPLQPGYYLGRLVGNYNSIPVYEVCDFSTLAGLDQGQLDTLRENLTPEQIAILDNLDPCQLRVLLTTLSIPQLQLITASSTPTQIQQMVPVVPIGRSSTLELITALTVEELLELTTTLTREQIMELMTTIPITQIQKITNELTTVEIPRVVTTLTNEQLINLLISTTNQQFGDLVRNLTTTDITYPNLINQPRLPLLAQLPPSKIQELLLNLTTTQITDTLNNLTVSQITTLLQLTATQIIDIIDELTEDEIDQLLTAITNPNQINLMLQVLTVPQLQLLLTNLTNTQLLTLTQYPPATLEKLVENMPVVDLALLLNQRPPAPVVGNPAMPPGIPVIVGQPSATPAALEGYAQTIATGDGGLYTYAGGQWNQIGGGGSGSGARTEGTLAATGSTQGDAAQITTDAVRVTGADDTKGVILPNTAGAIITLWNNSANTLKVYPPSGAKIDEGATNAAHTIANTGTIGNAWQYTRISSTQWFATILYLAS